MEKAPLGKPGARSPGRARGGTPGMEQSHATLCKTTALPLGPLRACLDHKGWPRATAGAGSGTRLVPWGVGITRRTVQGPPNPRLSADPGGRPLRPQQLTVAPGGGDRRGPPGWRRTVGGWGTRWPCPGLARQRPRPILLSLLITIGLYSPDRVVPFSSSFSPLPHLLGGFSPDLAPTPSPRIGGGRQP